MKSAKEFMTERRTSTGSNQSNQVNCRLLSLTKEMSDGEKLGALGEFAADLIHNIEGDIVVLGIS